MENPEFNKKVSELIERLHSTRSIKNQIVENYPHILPPEIKTNLSQLDELIREIEMQLSFIQ